MVFALSFFIQAGLRTSAEEGEKAFMARRARERGGILPSMTGPVCGPCLRVRWIFFLLGGGVPQPDEGGVCFCQMSFRGTAE